MVKEKTPFTIAVGERIKALRKKQGLTQEQLGSKIKITGSMISQYEQGSSLLSLVDAVELCTILGTDLYALAGIKKEAHPKGSLEERVTKLEKEIANILSITKEKNL